MKTLDKDKLPRHIAIIMDGNGRWAKRRGLNRITGHRKGIETAREIVSFCRELGIPYLTLYTFSRENWNRPLPEVKALMGLLERHLRVEFQTMMEKGIRFKAIGNIWELPEGVKGIINEVEEGTKGNKDMVLHLALSYSGRAEIIGAVKRLAMDIRDGRLGLDDVNEDRFSSYLYTWGVPDPDLLIRTSGERRISNFLLWQMAYTEIHVTDVLWPDFTREDLLKALLDFQGRERRFGLTGEQLKIRMG